MAEYYEKINWKDGADGGTPLSAENLNKMEEGISGAEMRAGSLEYDKETKGLATKNNHIGCKGYWWEAIDITNKIIYLSSSETNIENPEIVTTKEINTSFIIPTVDGKSYAVGDRFYIRNGVQHILEGKIVAINGNAIDYDIDLGITEIKAGEHYFCVPEKPKVGLLNLFSNMVSFGSLNISAGNNTFTAGYGNIGAGNKGTAFGDNNYVGNSAFAGGIGNLSLGTASVVFGAYNENYKWGGFVSGEENIAYIINGFVAGASNSGKGTVSMIFGQGNKHTGNFSSLLGCNLDNLGDNNILMGYANTTKKGNEKPTLKTIIIGNNNYGQFDNALVLGNNLIAGANNQIVLGQWNVPNGKSLVIGCGKSGARKNALEIDANGNAVFGGTVTDGNGNVLGNSTWTPIQIDNKIYYFFTDLTWEDNAGYCNFITDVGGHTAFKGKSLYPLIITDDGMETLGDAVTMNEKPIKGQAYKTA